MYTNDYSSHQQQADLTTSLLLAADDGTTSNNNNYDHDTTIKFGSSPLVVPVEVPEDDTSSSPTTTWTKGQKQPNKCHDIPFAIIFIIFYVMIFILGFYYTPKVIHQVPNNDHHDNSIPNNNKILFNTTMLILLSTLPISTFILLFFYYLLLNHTQSFIRLSLWIQVFTSLFFFFYYIIFSQELFHASIALLSSLLGWCYICSIRNRIPFASIHLSIALSCIRTNLVYILMTTFHFMVLFGFGWFILWCTSLMGVLGIELDCSFDKDDDNNNNKSCSFVNNHDQDNNNSVYIATFWIFILYWTLQVGKNIVGTITSGYVGTWYYFPNECQQHPCGGLSKSLMDSMKRCLTYNLGSICLGSLLVALVQTLRFVLEMIKSIRRDENRRRRRSNGDDGDDCAMNVLFCILDCILQNLEEMIIYFNKWAFIYVGLYGYNYTTSGKKVMTLFQQRGWSLIINDNIIRNTLLLITIMVGVATMIITNVFFSYYLSSSSSSSAGFMTSIKLTSFSIGILLSTIMMNIIDSAVNTVLVCFAESPQDLYVNHSNFSQDMKDAYYQAYRVRC